MGDENSSGEPNLMFYWMNPPLDACRLEPRKRSKQKARHMGVPSTSRTQVCVRRSRMPNANVLACCMPELLIRPAVFADLPRLTEIYNYYVVNTAVTFDVEPYTVERRTAWLEQFTVTGRYRLLVAEQDGQVVGYVGTTRFRPKAAYATTVETTIYCAPEAVGRGIGRRLYQELFRLLEAEDIHRFVAGYALPNPASAALHEHLGFKLIGIFSETGRKFGRYWDVAWTEREGFR